MDFQSRINDFKTRNCISVCVVQGIEPRAPCTYVLNVSSAPLFRHSMSLTLSFFSFPFKIAHRTETLDYLALCFVSLFNITFLFIRRLERPLSGKHPLVALPEDRASQYHTIAHNLTPSTGLCVKVNSQRLQHGIFT